MSSSLDELSLNSRDFYEYTKVKIVLSLTFGAFCLLLIGWCCIAGGNTSYINNYLNTKAFKYADQTLIDAENALAAGYGFACFFYFVAFIIATVASIYISPLFNGTKKEKAILSTPQELDAINV